MTDEELKQAVLEFKQIYLEEYNVMLSDQEASNKAILFLQLFDAVTTN